MSRISAVIALLVMSCAAAYALEAPNAKEDSIPPSVISAAQSCAQIHIGIANPQWNPISQLPREDMGWDQLEILKIPDFPLYVVMFTVAGPTVGGHSSTCFLDDASHQVVLVRYTYAHPGEKEIVIRSHEAVSRMQSEDLTELFENASSHRYEIDWRWFAPDS